MKNYKILGALAVIIILAVGLFSLRQKTVYHTEISAFELKPSASDAAGISPVSHFILKTTAALTPEVIQKYVEVTPKINVSVKKVESEENTFEIIPESELLPNTVYTLQVDKGPVASRDYSWAYQVKAPFALISTLPKDKGTYVPTNTGIEIEFNRDNIKNPESFISISPDVPGRFTISGPKVVFIPNTPLQERTLYTVTIKGGLGAEGTGDTLAQNASFQFETSQTGSVTSDYISFPSTFAEFKPGSDIVLAISTQQTTTAVMVYRFNSAQEYIDSVQKIQGDRWWTSYSRNVGANFSESQKVFSDKVDVDMQNSYTQYIHLPQQLPTGYYVVVAGANKITAVTWFQVNPAASFAAFSGKQSLIWLKDIGSGNNFAGTPISYNGKRIGTTGQDGVALFPTPAELVSTSTDYNYSSLSRKYFIAELATPVVIPFENEYGSPSYLNGPDKWWDYISLNKNIYLPTDTLRFWSLLKPREGNLGGDITVKLTSPYWRTTDGNIVTYAETKVHLSDFNAVTGELPFKDLKPNTYDLTFSQGDTVIAKQTVTVSAYVKPAYKISVSPDKTSIFAGDTVNFKVKAEFFDGTPVANTELAYEAYVLSDNIRHTVTLDEHGEGTFSITPTYTSSYSWPSYLQVTVKPTQSEEGSISAHGVVFVFGPHIYQTITQSQNSLTANFNVNTKAVVLGTGLRAEPYWSPESYLGGAVNGVQTSVDVLEVVYTKTQRGTGYDPINKLTYPMYDYKSEDRPIKTQVITSDINGNAQLSFQMENKKEYKFIFKATDSFGRTVSEMRYVYSGYDYAAYNPESYFSLNQQDYKAYKVGETYTLNLATSEGTMPAPARNGFIFMKVNNGAIEYQIQDTPTYTGVYKASDIPNVGVWPGWFANGRFHNSNYSYANLSFDANERRLNIDVTKDKESYKPGEKVSLDIRVTDKNKSPVRAEVNLSALDEAVFSIRTDERDIINEIYRDIYSQLMIRSSNLPPSGHGGAEKGGGEGDDIRSKIEEMAVYKTVVTDGAGYAHVEFTLPDNITSWRLTTQALTNELFAGKSVNFIKVTLPFFIDATLNKTYLAGDDLILRLRTFGVGTTGNQVTYTIESPTLAFKKLQTTDGAITELNLGQLPVGTHEITVRANDGTHTDALVRTINVLPSYFTKTTTDYYDAAPGVRIHANALGFTTLAFSSAGRGRIYNELSSMRWQWGQRLDQKGSAVIATDLLNAYFGEKNDAPDFDLTRYQDSYNGMQLLPYSSGDLDLTALSLYLFDQSTLETSSLKAMLYRVLTDIKTGDVHRSARALFGLAALHEPVLTKLQSLKDDTNLNTKDKAYIALALDEIGAKEEARVYYETSIKPSLDISGSYASIKDMKGDDAITGTMLLAALTASLDEAESAALALYVNDHQPKETLVNFEELLYFKKLLPKLSDEPVTFTYTAGTKKGTKTLNKSEVFELTLSPAEIESFSLGDVTGKLAITSTYEESSSPSSIKKDSDLRLDRVYRAGELYQAKEFKEGDLVRVDLNAYFTGHALTGAYQVVDYLPSGLRIADEEATGRYNDDYSYRIYPTEINDQKITFVIYSDMKKPVYYYARVVTKGVYKAEPATLQSLRNPDSITTSHEDTVTIK